MCFFIGNHIIDEIMQTKMKLLLFLEKLNVEDELWEIDGEGFLNDLVIFRGVE